MEVKCVKEVLSHYFTFAHLTPHQQLQNITEILQDH